MKTDNFFRPIICCSACLEFKKCRYSGEVIPDLVIRKLLDFVDFIPVCPEVEIGLGIPRKAVRLCRENDEIKMFQPVTGEDFTDRMWSFTNNFLDKLSTENYPDAFILKHKSPSCGINNVKIYNNKESYNSKKGNGLFANAAIEQFENAIFEDEGRLSNFTIREHFFTLIFAAAHLRSIIQTGAFRDLVDFHSCYKYLLMGYSQQGLKKLGKIVASGSKKSFVKSATEYRDMFIKTLAKPPGFKSMINSIQHMYGYFSDDLEKPEKMHFLNLIEEYRDERIPLSVLINILKSWAIRFKQDYILQQKILAPFPKELMMITDSGKGRKL